MSRSPEGEAVRRAVVVVNGGAGGARRALPRLRAALERAGLAVEALHVVPRGKLVRKTVRRAIRAGAPLVVVGGGDGTLSRAVGEFAGRRTVLGVLPLGTGNSFARSLGLPLGLDAAAAVIAHGREARVDLGTLGDRYFANFATIGLSSEIAASVDPRLKPIVGPVAYVLGALRPLLRERPFAATVAHDGDRTELVTRQLVIASGRCFGTTPVLPHASIDDGRLALFTTRGRSLLSTLRMYLAFGAGAQTRLPDAVTLSAETIAVRTSPRQRVALDGERAGKTPARFGVARAALRVYLPRDGEVPS